MLPGLVNSHIHPVLGINLADSLDLNAVTTLADVLRALSEHAAGLAPDAWVEAWRLDPNAFGDRPLEPMALAQGLTAIEALIGYTVGPAYAAGAKDAAGRIKAGYLADLSILAVDPVTVRAEELPDVPVTHTVVDGQLYTHATDR